MAEGRIVKKSIAEDECVAQLSIDSQLLFARAIPFQDNEGRMPGDPGAVRELAVPLIAEWTDEYVDALIAEWEVTHKRGGVPSPLVIRYPLDPPRLWRDREASKKFQCRLALEFCGFKNQPGRLRRGAPSALPPPPDVVNVATLPLGHLTTSPVDRSAHSVSAHARGSWVSSKEEPVLKDQPQAAAARARTGELPDDLSWFSTRFVEVFGRQPRVPSVEESSRLRAALATAGRTAALELLRERADKSVRNLNYFVDALNERGQVRAATEDHGLDFDAYTRA